LIHMEDSFFIHFHVNLIHNSRTCWSNSSIITNSIYYPVHFQKVPNGPIIECGENFIHDHPHAHRHRRTYVRADTQASLSLSLSRTQSLSIELWSSFESQNISYYKYMHALLCMCMQTVLWVRRLNS
jgi:hypothetical protein